MVTNFCCASAGSENDVSAATAPAITLSFFAENFICRSLHFSSGFIEAAPGVALGGKQYRSVSGDHGGVDGISQSIDDLVDRAAIDNERRRQQNVIALCAVHRSAH